MFGRQYVSGTNYRYGFNDKEKDDEIFGAGDSYDYGYRFYNPSIGRFLSVDPLSNKYPYYSPYHFAGLNQIRFIDLDGLEPDNPTGLIWKGVPDPTQKVQSAIDVSNKVLKNAAQALNKAAENLPNKIAGIVAFGEGAIESANAIGRKVGVSLLNLDLEAFKLIGEKIKSGLNLKENTKNAKPEGYNAEAAKEKVIDTGKEQAIDQLKELGENESIPKREQFDTTIVNKPDPTVQGHDSSIVEVRNKTGKVVSSKVKAR